MPIVSSLARRGATPALLAALLLAPRSQEAPALEYRAANGSWRAWPAFAPRSSARRVDGATDAIAWRDTQPGLRVGDFTVRTGDGMLTNSIAVVELDPARLSFALVAARGWERRLAADWMAGDSTLVLVANTGLFRDTGSPIGLVQLDGVRRTGPVAWLDVVVGVENGALLLTDAPGIESLGPGASAFQTIPWLVRDGVVAFGATSGVRLSRTHRDRRITLCQGDDGLIRLLLSNFEVFGAEVGRVPVGLTIPEQAALAAGLGCRDAVALDGGISAQIAVRGQSRVIRMPGWRKVPLMLVARRR
jgi:phosphodiester glycosidase